MSRRARGWVASFGVVVLVVLYAVAHSPARQLISESLGQISGTCYVTCLAVPVDRMLVAALSVMGVLFAIASGRAFAMATAASRLDRVLIFGLSTTAILVVVPSWVGGSGLAGGIASLQPPGGLLACVGITSVIWAVVRRRPVARTIPGDGARSRPTPLLAVVAACGLALLVGSLTVRLTHPPSSYDALAYHLPLSRLLWTSDLGSFMDDASYWALAHPGAAELLQGWLRFAGGVGAEAATQVPYALLGAAGVAAVARHSGLRDGAAALAGASWMLVPIVALQLGTGLNDVTATGMFLGAVGLAAAPVHAWSMGRAAIVGVGAGLVFATKLALLPAVAGAAVGLLLWSAARARHDGRAVHRRAIAALPWRPLTVALSAALILVAPWWVRNALMFGNPAYPAAVPFVGAGIAQQDLGLKDAEFVPSSLLWPLYPLLEAHSEHSGVGPLTGVGILGMLLLWGYRRRAALALPLATAVAVLPAWWFLTRHEPRFLLPLAGIALAYLPWTLIAVPRARRRVASAAIAGGAILSAAVTFTSGLAPLASQPTQPVRFYDEIWGVMPAVLDPSLSDGLLWEHGCASLDYPAYLPLLDPPGGDERLRQVVTMPCGQASRDVVATMERHGLEYVYVTADDRRRAVVEAGHPPTSFLLVAADARPGADGNARSRYLFKLRRDAGVVTRGPGP